MIKHRGLGVAVVLLSSFAAWIYCIATVVLGLIYQAYPGQENVAILISTLPTIVMMLAAFALKLDDAPIRNVRCETSDDGPGLLEKFCELLPLFSGQADSRRLQKKDERTQNIVSYFQEHFSAKDFCPAAAASAFSISEKHLYTLLKENTGQTPAALLLELRLTHAAAQLRESGKPIQVICEESGFANFNTFYKAFKRAYAVSPSQYRDL